MVEGRTLACKWVRLACKRHLEDLARERDPDFPYRFDPQKGARACRFIELLPHIKGEWARPAPGRSNLIKLEAWEKFIVCAIFAWVDKKKGLRRYSEAYVCVPRKNAKSTLAAAIALYMLAADGEYGAEVYSGATTEKQAWEVFRPAWLMVKRTPELEKYFGIQHAAKSLFVEEDGSRFEPVVGDPGDGSSPSCAVVDEFHEHASSNLYDTMKTGMGARSQPLMLVITTAGSNIAGPCHDLQIEVQKVLEGLVENESLFGVIYTIDEGDDWTSEAALRKANPNFGVSVSGTFLKKQIQEAVQQAAKQNIVKTKHLNIWVGAATSWMNMEAWRKCEDQSLKIEEFLGHDCYAAGDLSAKIDIAGYMRVFVRKQEDGRHYYVFGRYYLPLERAMDPKCQHYQKWVHEKALEGIPGAEIRFETIKADMLADCKRYNMRCIGFDPWGAQQLQQELSAELPEDTVITIPQQTRFLSEPMKEIEAAVITGHLHHDGDKPLAWMMSNIVARADANGNLFPRKEKAENKIDGGVALIMAVSRAMLGHAKEEVGVLRTGTAHSMKESPAKFDLQDLLLCIGSISLIGGIAVWSRPAAAVVFGLMCFGFVFLIQTSKKGRL